MSIESDRDHWVQWKGTGVCVGIHCICGAHHHHDGEFFYFFRCPRCKRRFAVGTNVKMIELSDAEADSLDQDDFDEPSAPANGDGALGEGE